MVIGASAGALNGWAIAGGVSSAELIEQWLHPSTAGLMSFRLPVLPWHGFFDPRPLEELVRELFARHRPRVPFAGTLVELPGMRLRLVSQEAMTWRHLMAMCAVPFGFPPMRLDGRWYVDGGLRGALPVWAAARMGASRVIAIDALPRMPSRMARYTLKAVQWAAGGMPPAGDVEVWKITPGRALGPLRSAIHWNPEQIREWIRLGEEHGLKLGLCRSTGFIV